MYPRRQSKFDLYTESVNKEVAQATRVEASEISRLEKEREKLGNRFEWVYFWFNPIFAIGIGLAFADSFWVGIGIFLVPQVLIKIFDYSKSEKESIYTEIAENISENESKIQQIKTKIVFERNSRPEGMRHFDTAIYERLISDIKTKAQTTTTGRSYVYHIATKDMTLEEGYVGVTTNFLRRENEHFCDLHCGSHTNSKLQKAFDLFGSELKMKILHSNISESESYALESRYRPAPGIGLNIRQGGL
ncbi:TPA: hypothetical protein N2917_004405 [Vibrio parahaemolyticus]|uniref:hypothetical protein n=1 Tax=Vibrio parahaemolyticus TaxID=670 RepID=UPI001869EB56|nr:hypothetical protein [Vibrio parahaemolyticus]MBE4138620.1 hypothetical protein [Vibrio parahaemolyticus]MCG0035595.1 hypothetical protein [Vibrio parahaemolyticus]MCX8946516.1 hypothetical protein [Vibrio parahaemolyticus]HCM1475894.1 hypothetical protein [Vibrio parahaemolyticus]